MSYTFLFISGQLADGDNNDAATTSLSTLDLMWKPKKFKYDSSDSEHEDSDQEEEMQDVEDSSKIQ